MLLSLVARSRSRRPRGRGPFRGASRGLGFTTVDEKFQASTPGSAASTVAPMASVPGRSVGAVSTVLPDYVPPKVQKLPTMDELDAFAADLDSVDRTLAELDR